MVENAAFIIILLILEVYAILHKFVLTLLCINRTIHMSRHIRRSLIMNNKIQKMCIAALLCAVGILIPVISPVKINLGAMSFTLASHVALFLAMFISPAVAAVVCIGTTMGFFIAGFPLVVVARAASQIVFVLIGAYLLRKYPNKFSSPLSLGVLAVSTGVIHAAFEVLVVFGFTFMGVPLKGDVIPFLFGLVGVGTFAHSIVDFIIALLIWAPCSKIIKIPHVANFAMPKA